MCRSCRRQTPVYDARDQGAIKIECRLHSVVVTVPQGPRQIAPGFNLGNGVLSTNPESRRDEGNSAALLRPFRT